MSYLSSSAVLESLQEATSLPIDGLDTVQDFLEKYFYQKLLFPDKRPLDIGYAITVPGTDHAKIIVTGCSYVEDGNVTVTGRDEEGIPLRALYPKNGVALYPIPLALDEKPILNGQKVFDVLTTIEYRVDSVEHIGGAPIVTAFPLKSDRGVPIVAGSRRFVHAFPLKDAGGEFVFVDDSVFDIDGGGPYRVDSIVDHPRPMIGLLDETRGEVRRFYRRPEEVVHRHEAIDIDAVPILCAEIVYLLDSTDPCTVLAVSETNVTLRCENDEIRVVKPTEVTHECPILDGHGARIARFDRVWLIEDRYIDMPAAEVIDIRSPEAIVLKRRGADGTIVTAADHLTHVRPMTQSRLEANVHGLIDGLSGCLDGKTLDSLREGVVGALAQQRDLDASVSASSAVQSTGKRFHVVDEPPTRLGRLVENAKIRYESWMKKNEKRIGVVHVRRS